MYKINFKDRIFEQDGSIKTTRVQIQEDMTVITRVLKGDVYSLDDEMLIKNVLEQFYQDTFPNRAENEKFEKMEKALKDSTETLDTTRKTLAQSVLKEFEYESSFDEINNKFDFLAKHLNVTYPVKEEHEDDEEGSSIPRETETN